MRRVVITGRGTVNPLGADVPSTLAAMADGTCAIGTLTCQDADRLSIQIGAEVRGFEPAAHFDKPQLGLLDRFAQFALVAAREAMTDAAITLTPDRTAVIMGTSGGGFGTQNDAYRAVFQDGKSRVHPFTVPRLMANAAASHISMGIGVTGPTYTVSTACASSNHAIGQAYQMIASGMVEAALAGGAEAMLSFGGIKAWEGLRVLSPTGCRPFCSTRDGMVQGEGAAVFVLEDRDAALARGATVYAEITGFGMTSDARDIVMPSQHGAEAAMRRALGNTAPQSVGYINAHGTGTRANDQIEVAAICAVFGDHADHLLVSSTKSMHGHLIGAAGAVELLGCLMALDGTVPPTVGVADQDAACDLDVVAGSARATQIDMVLSNAFAFGGLNAVLALARPT